MNNVAISTGSYTEVNGCNPDRKGFLLVDIYKHKNGVRVLVKE